MKIILIYIAVLLSSFHLPNNGLTQYVNDFKVNDDNTSKLQWLSSVDATPTGYFVIAWEDFRNAIGNFRRDIYFQIFNQTAKPIGGNIRVNLNDTLSSMTRVAIRDDSTFAITWFNGNYKLKLFNKLGVPLSSDININDSTLYTTYPVAIDTDHLGNLYCFFYVTTSFNTPRTLFYQKFNPSGLKLGSNIKINDDVNNVVKEHPGITVLKNGYSIVVWRDSRLTGGTGGGDIYMQMLDSNGNKIGVNTLVNDDGSFAVDQNYPSVSADSSGNFNITWEDNRLTINSYQPYCQAYNSSGVKIGSNFRVDQGLSTSKHRPVISKRSDGRYVIGWANSGVPMFRRFNSVNVAISGNDTVSKPYIPIGKNFNFIKIIEDRIITVWTDKRNEPEEGDIYCNIRSFQNPDSVITFINPIYSNISHDYQLYQNYPNPFNPTTKITFDIPYNTNVTLSLYNSLGQNIATFINEKLTAGKYEYIWNAQELPSGVYFYILRTKDFYTAKTALLIK